MRSMRASRSPAVASATTANGSIGARRKRLFVFMRGILYRKDTKTGEGSDGSERVPDATEELRAARGGDGIARPRNAARKGEREVMHERRVARQLAADRRADVRRVEARAPRVPGVDKPGRVHRSQKHRPRADAALDAQERHAHVEIHHRGVESDDILGIEAAQQSDRVAAEVEDLRRGSGTGGREDAARPLRSP